MSLAPGRLSRSGILLAAILAALPFVPGLISGRTLYYRDVGQNHLPDRALGARMMREGQLPLWNPHRGNGQPFLANPNSMVLRPTTPLFLLLPAGLAHVAFTLSVILLMGVAAAGTFALLRDTGHGASAALVGASAFALSGAFQSLGQFANLLEGAAWIPVTLFLLNRALVRGRHPWAVLAGVSLALVVSCGEPILAGVTLLGAAALPGFRTAARRDATVACGVALLLAVLIASVQILPLWDLASMSARSVALPAGEALKWSLPPAALLQAIIPSLWGDPSRAAPTAYWGSGLFDTSLPFLPSIHLGLPVLLLAGAGLRRGAGRWLLALAAAAGTALSLGRFLPFHGLVERWVPGLAHTRYPVKWMLLVSWAVALLAAAGFERLVGENRPAPGRRRALRVSGGLLALLAALGAVVWWRVPAAAAGAVRSLLGVPSRITDGVLVAGAVPAIALGLAAGAAAGLALVWVAAWRGARPRLRSALAAAICVAALLSAAWKLNPTAPPGVVFARSPLLDRIPEGSWRDLRLFGFPRPPGFAFRSPSAAEARAAGLPADSLAWGMRWDNRSLRFVAPYLHGVMGAYDQGGESLLGLEPGASVARRLREGIDPDAAARLLRAASVGWVVAYGNPAIPDLAGASGLPGESNISLGLYRLESTVPRVSLRARAVTARSPGEAVSLLAAGRTDPATEVVLEGDRPETGPAGGGPESGVAGEAFLTEERACEVHVHVRAARPAWLVLTDTWDPWWRSRIDGQPAPVLRADGMFRAVHVPAGEHDIEFTYRPAPVELGALGTLTGLLAAAGLLVAGRRAAGGEAA